MAHSPAAFDRGTRFTNYSSIHSADAFVGDYQVMFTPGNSPPPARVPKKPAKASHPTKATRFRPREGSVQGQTGTQSYILPNNIPNTSQIVPNTSGILPEVQVRYTIPADEKQIVASLRMLQHNLNDALRKIDTLTHERDEARQELKLLKTSQTKQRKISSPQSNIRIAAQVDEELFNFSRLDESPKKAQEQEKIARPIPSMRNRETQPAVQPVATKNDPEPEQRLDGNIRGQSERKQYKRAAIEDQENSIAIEQPTAASNTSRFRRPHALDENMTSAYILPDITVAQPQKAKALLSKEAQDILHDHEPEHINNCEVCRRLITTNTPKPAQQQVLAQITEMLHDTELEDANPTLRPKISPNQALLQIRRQTKKQFEHAKERFHEAFGRYNAIKAPLTSKKHERIAEEMKYWQGRMEEYRVNLDNLRDVEEGMLDDLDV